MQQLVITTLNCPVYISWISVFCTQKRFLSQHWLLHWPSYCCCCGLEEWWVGSSGQLEYWGFNTLNTHCLAIAICSSVSTEHAVGVWKRSLSKLIQKNVFLLNPCSKGKYVTHSYMHTRNWSLLLKRRTYSLTFFCIFFQPLKVGNAYKFNIDLWQVSHEAAAAPTSLICGDVHRGELRRVGALVRNTIDRLDLEAVLGVGL